VRPCRLFPSLRFFALVLRRLSSSSSLRAVSGAAVATWAESTVGDGDAGVGAGPPSAPPLTVAAGKVVVPPGADGLTAGGARSNSGEDPGSAGPSAAPRAPGTATFPLPPAVAASVCRAFRRHASPTGLSDAKCLRQFLSLKRMPVGDMSSEWRSTKMDPVCPLRSITFSTTGLVSQTVFRSAQQKTVDAPRRTSSWLDRSGVSTGLIPKPTSTRSSRRVAFSHRRRVMSGSWRRRCGASAGTRAGAAAPRDLRDDDDEAAPAPAVRAGSRAASEVVPLESAGPVLSAPELAEVGRRRQHKARHSRASTPGGPFRVPELPVTADRTGAGWTMRESSCRRTRRI
jgi:hypothetical protein